VDPFVHTAQGRIVTLDDEEVTMNDCRELLLVSEEKTLEYLEEAVQLADDVYITGFMALKRVRLEDTVTDW